MDRRQLHPLPDARRIGERAQENRCLQLKSTVGGRIRAHGARQTNGDLYAALWKSDCLGPPGMLRHVAGTTLQPQIQGWQILTFFVL